MAADRQARIRERAYQIWLDEGRIDGRQDAHWHRAERELAEEEARPRPEKAAHGSSPADPRHRVPPPQTGAAPARRGGERPAAPGRRTPKPPAR